jgi:multiple sugar transport system permease protein
MASMTYSKSVNTAPHYSVQLRKFATYAMVTMIALIFSLVYLLPFANMALLSVKTQDQVVTGATGSVLPLEPLYYNYEGEDYSLYNVPTEDGVVHQWALVEKSRQTNQFIDPANPEAGLIPWTGNWRGLEPVTELRPHFSNYPLAWEMINFPRLFGNTMFIALIGMVGTVISSICVAYAFARFPIPGKNILFIILIGTIILPGQVTLIPTYMAFAKMGWTGTRLPLIVPHFFANAYNVFLLRQFFMTLPKELDEAAMIDGADPLRILLQVILPMAWPAVITVALFHFIFAWNDYFGPLLYLLGQPELQPISIGVQIFNFQYGARPELIQATSLMAMILPVGIFFVAQKIFMRGVVITGVEK